ncbi:MAG: cadherin-like domain-containing protein [Saprospiraceae bacterium]|nr:cadherin-like domain-containing protein [Saprospiraceae bacterium]
MKTSIILLLIALLGGFQPDLVDVDTSPTTLHQTDSLQKISYNFVNAPVKISLHALDWNVSASQSLLSPMVAASKSYMVVGTDLGPMGPSPGDTIEYQVDITNSMAAMDGTGVLFSDVIDANTTLVPGSVKTSPIAVNDSYTTVGNISISVPVGAGLLVNDVELDGDMISVTSVNTTGTQGDVSFNMNGSFTFNPAPGFEGITTFTYDITDGFFTRTGTVSINVSGLIWFIQSGAPMGGDGRLGSPFNNVASFSSTANDEANDNIFIYSGNYTGSIVLLDGQNIIGQSAVGTLAGLTGVTFSIHQPITPLPILGGTNPIIVNSVTTLTTAMNNDIYAITINNSGGTSLTGTNLGTIKIRDVLLSNSAGIALNLSNGVLDVILKSVSASMATHGLRLLTTTGSLAMTGTGTTDGSGGNFSNISIRAVELIDATNITLNNLILNNANTTDSGFDGVCDEDDNINCNAAIYLKDISTIALNNIDITTTEEHGINGNNVTNLSIVNSTSTSNGNSNEEHALKLRNLFGTCSIIDCTFSLSAFRIAHIINNSGALTLTVDNCTFNNTIASMVGADCFEMRTQGSATATVHLKNSDFLRAASKGIQALAEGSSTFNLNVTNCRIERFGQPMAGIEVGSVNTATMNYNIIGNSVIEASGKLRFWLRLLIHRF